jgi:phospholipase/lecithinase/hemolysin
MIVDCATRMAELFSQLPMLTGFTVQESATLTADRAMAALDAQLSLADVSVEAWPGLHPGPELHAEIASAILEVIKEHPDAREFFRGSTFARAFH